MVCMSWTFGSTFSSCTRVNIGPLQKGTDVEGVRPSKRDCLSPHPWQTSNTCADEGWPLQLLNYFFRYLQLITHTCRHYTAVQCRVRFRSRPERDPRTLPNFPRVMRTCMAGTWINNKAFMFLALHRMSTPCDRMYSVHRQIYRQKVAPQPTRYRRLVS